jgi:FdhD protein
MADPRVSRVTVLRHDGLDAESVSDSVAVEEPVEIRLGEEPIAVTMRTPGDDYDLTLGFLLTEGILLDPAEVVSIDTVGESALAVRLRKGVDVDASRFRRNMFVSSSCGVCGKTSIESVRLLAPAAKAFSVSREFVASLTTILSARQPTFDVTGGLHGAGLVALDGQVLSVREDVGRHNAVDKVIGATARTQWPVPPSLLVVSGRQSFEIVQKAAMAGIGGVVGVSAPSSLAVELADTLGMLLVGFSRHEHFNVYSGARYLDS